jgi:hypothetical protein
MKELTEADKHVTEETRELLVSLDEKQRELTEHQTRIVNIKKYASDLQTLLVVKQIEKDVETQDNFILNLSFLVLNIIGVGHSILSNFTNNFNHFFNQMLNVCEHI